MQLSHTPKWGGGAKQVEMVPEQKGRQGTNPAHSIQFICIVKLVLIGILHYYC